MLHFKEYHNNLHPEFIGTGWGLYKDDKATDYYIFNISDSKEYKLYYGNGFDIKSDYSLEYLQNLVIKLFEQFPRMVDDKKGFDAEEYREIKSSADTKT